MKRYIVKASRDARRNQRIYSSDDIPHYARHMHNIVSGNFTIKDVQDYIYYHDYMKEIGVQLEVEDVPPEDIVYEIIKMIEASAEIDYDYVIPVSDKTKLRGMILSILENWE